MGATQTCCTSTSDGKIQRLPRQRSMLEDGDDSEEEDEEEDSDEEEEECKIWVRIIVAKGLRSGKGMKGDGHGTYCCEVGTSDAKFSAMSQGQEPVWNVEMSMSGCYRSNPLTFSVFGVPTGTNSKGTRKLVGETAVPGAAFLSDGFSGELRLQGSLARKAYLTISIRPSHLDVYPPLGSPADGYSCRIPLSRSDMTTSVMELDANPVDAQFARIIGAPTGPLQAYNETAEADFTVLENDFVSVVNGYRDPTMFRDALALKPELLLEARRGTQFTVHVKKGKDMVMGLEMYYDMGHASTVVISKINEGAVQAWNKERPEEAVLKCDRLISVDGVSGRADGILKALANGKDEIELTLLRPSPGGTSDTPVNVRGLTRVASNDQGLLDQPDKPKAKTALVQVYVRSERFGGTDKSANGHCFDAIPLANGMIRAGMSCQLIHYRCEEHEQFVLFCAGFDVLILRCTLGQIEADGGNRARFLEGLRHIERCGTHVWPSPEEMARLSARDSIAMVGDLRIGLPDTQAYYTPSELSTGFRKTLAFQPRVVSHGRDKSGEGVWSVRLQSGNYCSALGARFCTDDELLVLVCLETGQEETHSLGEFIEFCISGRTTNLGGCTWASKSSGKYFEGGREAGGFVVDRQFFPGSDGSEVSCSMIGNTCVGVSHKTGNSSIVQRFAQTSGYFIEDLNKLAPALGLQGGLPLWWSVSFELTTQEGKPNKSAEEWKVIKFDCIGAGIAQCRAAACTRDDPTASYNDIAAGDRIEAGQVGQLFSEKVLAQLNRARKGKER